MSDIEEMASPAKVVTTKGGKKVAVEKMYQKKTQLEHILLRPDTYIGSVEKHTETMWVMDQENNCMVQKNLTYCPGLYKIFDEILVNAADNKIRDPTMTAVRIDIKPGDNMIKIWNNGKGIPVVHHKVEKMYVPSLIFGHLLTSSNYDDSEQKVTGGRNGYGAKLANIFSKKFIVETSCHEYKSAFKQTWVDNMTKTTEPIIHPDNKEDFTSITFYPDLDKFHMTEMDQDHVDLFTRRAYDVAASSKGVKIYLNGKKLPVNGFKDYVELFLQDKVDEQGNPLKVVYEQVNDRWEVAITLSSTGFQQVSFVNSIATTKGGRHVDFVADKLIAKLMEIVKKKSGKAGVTIKPFQIRNHLWVFVNCLIVNPTFDSQTKETMTLQAKNFGSTCSLSEKFILQASKCGIVESIMNWVKFKAMEKMDTKCHKSKHSKLKGIPKLDDANQAGTKNSRACTLILTEGDSAKALAVAGLGVVGRDHYGVFPLRGKLLNVRDAPTKQVIENVEINNLIKILGLQYKQKYENSDTLNTLRYGKIMIMTDQDQDGSHIKGLIINFIHHNWPSLLKYSFIEQFITPIVKVFKAKKEMAFFSIPEFEEWQKGTPNWYTWRIKYYKGLGTSSSKEAKEYFSEMTRHRVRFRHAGQDDDDNIQLVFNKTKADARKEWLTKWMTDKKRRIELGLPETYLYAKETSAISYHDFVNKELVLFSNMDNERSIPNIMDGFKPGQRKVMFTCFKRNLVKEIKVAQLAGSVAELSAYHHGEVSLMGTIIGLAQDFIGTNNINLLIPSGQFGTRLSGGKDAASPRYIFTNLSPLARAIFHPHDDPILKYIYEDNQRIEPEWYCPIIPMVLVNGAEGIGTGWKTTVLNFKPHDIINNLKLMIDDKEPKPMLPFYKGYTGVIKEIEPNRYAHFGEIAVIDETTVEITELPLRTWTQNYKENVLEIFLNGGEGKDKEKNPPKIEDYKEYHTDTTVRFVVTMTAAKLAEAEHFGLHKFFKLQSTLSTNSMVLFDHTGCIKRYTSPQEILQEYYDIRVKLYQKRKDYMEGALSAEALKLENQARFVLEKIENKIVVENIAKKEMIRRLSAAGYDSDPVKAWKESIDKLAALEEGTQGPEEGAETRDGEEDAAAKETGPDYHYILNMPIWSLTREKKEDLLKQRDDKQKELRILRHKTPKDLWREDLEHLLAEIERLRKEVKAEDDARSKKELDKKVAAAKSGRAAKVTKMSRESMPAPGGRRIEPEVDESMFSKPPRAPGAAVRAGKGSKKNPLIENGDNDNEDANGMDFDDNNDDDLPKPLMQRLSAGGVDIPDDMKQPARKLHIVSTKAGGSKKPTGDAGAKKKAGPKKTTSPKKKAAGGSKKKKNPLDMSDDSDDDEGDASDGSDDDILPKKVSKPAAKKKDTAAAPKTKKLGPSILTTKTIKAPKPSPKKGKKKADPWATDSEGDSMESDVDLDVSGSISEIVPLRERIPKRQAAAKVKFNFGDDVEEVMEEEGEVCFHEVDHGQGSKPLIRSASPSDAGLDSEEEKPVKKAPPKKKPASPKKVVIDSDESELGKVSPVKKPAPKKKATSSKFAAGDSDLDSDLDNSPVKKMPVKKRAAPSKKAFSGSDSDNPSPKKSKYVFDSDSDFDESSFQKKKGGKKKLDTSGSDFAP